MRVRRWIGMFALAGNLSAAEPEFRTWTDINQRQVEAALETATDTQVTLKLRAGPAVTVPLSSLSAADRQWLADRKSGGQSLPASSAEWPRSVGLNAEPKITVIREDASTKDFVYESDHYEFHCDSKLSANLVREISRVFEATWRLNCVLPLDLKPQPEESREKFRARIFTKTSDYLKLAPNGSAGVYSSRAQELMVPLSSLGVKMVGSRVSIDYQDENYRTLVHEITHQMMNHWLPRLPVWLTEGAAEYVELAKYENGRFLFSQQEKNLERHLALIGEYLGDRGFTMIPLETLMTIDSKQWLKALESERGATRNYASALALTYYFYHLDGDGKGTHFKDYLRALEKAASPDDLETATLKHLLRDRDYATLQVDVEKSYRRIGAPVRFPEASRKR